MNLSDLKSYLENLAFEKNVYLDKGELNILLANTKDIVALLCLLKEDPNLKFLSLIDLCAADYPSRSKRFEVIYHLLSYKNNLRLRIKVQLKENEKCESVSNVYSSAVWFEREAFDLFGVEFNNLSDHRRILTDYNFEGFPLRKDFPLTGFKEVRYSLEAGRIETQDVKLAQEFRNFDFEMPWEGTQYLINKEDGGKK